MFGFIASPCPRCTSVGLPHWRGTFCGLARTLARDYSAPARLLVNRDATFLALLGLSVDPSPPNWRKATCCNPLATPFPVDDSHPAIAHAAAVSVCGLATKLSDDSLDERGFRRFLSKSGSRLVSPATDRAIARLNSSAFPTASVIDRLDAQSQTESDLPLNADGPTATSFGLITGHLGQLLGLPKLEPALTRLGTAHGQLVYWRDAWDDRSSDLKKKRFNPFFVVEPSLIHARIAHAWTDFSSALADLRVHRHTELLEEISRNTGNRHADFLGIERKKKKEKTPKRPKDRDRPCCDSCSACDCCHCNGCGNCGGKGSKGGCDGCFDCGPGDSGCIDCCPCDGCDCCPCN